jgi:hypothetical protein
LIPLKQALSPAARFSGTSYSTTESGVDTGRGVLLHRLRDMTVKIERGRDRRVPEPFLRDFRMNTGEQELHRVTVPQIMKADPREVGAKPGEEAGKFVCQALRLQRLAIGPRAQ